MTEEIVEVDVVVDDIKSIWTQLCKAAENILREDNPRVDVTDVCVDDVHMMRVGDYTRVKGTVEVIQR